MNKRQFACVAFAVSAVSFSPFGLALADDAPSPAPSTSSMVISGFGTAAMTSADTDQAQFGRPGQAAGVQSSPRPGPDSNFGLQGTYKWNDQFSFTAQGLVRKSVTDNFGAEMAWAFFKYKANDEFSFRVGRIGAPIYMISDFRNVGYANPMIRPPEELYGQVVLDNFNGADVIYQHSFGDNTLTAQFAVGEARSDSPSGYYVRFQPFTALHVLYETGPFTFRFGRADASFSIYNYSLPVQLDGFLNQFGFSSIANQLPYTDVKGSFTSVGMMMDYKNFIIQTEYAKRNTKTLLEADTTSWYAMFGYRIDKFTPYYMHANVTQDSQNSFPSMPTTGLLAPLTAAANGAVKALLESSNAVGVRWDFYKSADLKFQFDRISPRNGPGFFLNPQPGFTGPVNVYALGVDFIF
ncbi:MAG TPA: hypothetical protein VNW52_06995 [Burkholderiaceae bacterium]|jgi:hypothetical protein|nr:hypothetical protein [Burkholderiaceae bacterium]